MATSIVSQGIFSPATVRAKRVERVQNNRNFVKAFIERSNTAQIAVRNASWMRAPPTSQVLSGMTVNTRTSSWAAPAMSRCSSAPRKA